MELFYPTVVLDGRHENICCEKISNRLRRLCDGLREEFIDIVRHFSVANSFR